MKIADLRKVLGSVLKSRGFQKKGTRWIYEMEQCYLVWDFVASRNSPGTYGLLVCIWFLEMNEFPAVMPHSGGYPMSCSLDKMVEGGKQLEDQFYSLDWNKLPIADRVAVIESIAPAVIDQLLREWGSIDLIKQNYFSGRLKAAQINWQVRDYFGDADWRSRITLPDGVIRIITPDD